MGQDINRQAAHEALDKLMDEKHINPLAFAGGDYDFVPRFLLERVEQMDINEVKDDILRLLDACGGRDLGSLKEYFEETDFYTAPASRYYHYSHHGGLAQHSLQCLYLMKHLVFLHQFHTHIDFSSVVVSALCHDLCKVNFYFPSEDPPSEAQLRYVKDLFKKAGRELKPDMIKLKNNTSKLIDWALHRFEAEQPKLMPQWEIKDDFPFGHGERSALEAQQLLPDITKEELLAIRWHGDTFEISESNKYAHNQVRTTVPLVLLLSHADQQTGFILEPRHK